MPNIDLTQLPIAAVAGVIISLLFSWLPGLSTWYDQLTPTPKKLLMLLVLVVTTAGLMVYKCRTDGACYSANVETYLAALFAALWSNQSAHGITPLPVERRLVRKLADEKSMAIVSAPIVPIDFDTSPDTDKQGWPPVHNETNFPKKP